MLFFFQHHKLMKENMKFPRNFIGDIIHAPFPSLQKKAFCSWTKSYKCKSSWNFFSMLLSKLIRLKGTKKLCSELLKKSEKPFQKKLRKSEDLNCFIVFFLLLFNFLVSFYNCVFFLALFPFRWIFFLFREEKASLSEEIQGWKCWKWIYKKVPSLMGLWKILLLKHTKKSLIFVCRKFPKRSFLVLCKIFLQNFLLRFAIYAT